MSAEEKPTTSYVPPMVQDDVAPDDSEEPPESELADEGGIASISDNPGSSTASEENTETKAAIKLKDAVGRMFIIPWHIARSWKGVSDFINEAFKSVMIISRQVSRGQYDLLSPDGEIILPMAWEHVIQPGWRLTMVMWPLVKESKGRPPSERRPPPPSVPIIIDRPAGTASPGRRPERRPLPPTERPGVPPPIPNRYSKSSRALLDWISGRTKKIEVPPESRTDRGRQSRPRFMKDLKKSKRARRGAVNLQLGLNHENASRRSPSSVSTASSSSSSSSPPYPPARVGTPWARRAFPEGYARPRLTLGKLPRGFSATRMRPREKRLVVVCKVHDRPIRRPTQLPNGAGRHALSSPERLVLASARTCWEGPARISLAALELIAQKRKIPLPIEQDDLSTERDHATWLHVRRSVMNFHEFEDIAQFDLAQDRATSSAISHLLRTIRAEKLDDDWYIKPATILRCDTEAGESPAASALFVSVPYLCASSFTGSSATEKADGICAPRRLHEAFSILSASIDRDKDQGFRTNEGRAADQVLWVRQVWVLITESGLLTYGNISKQDLEGDSITVREPTKLDEEGDKIIQLVDEDRRLYYSSLSKCKSFYELQIEVRNQMFRAGHAIEDVDIQLEVSEGEPITPEKWSSLLKQSDIPLIKISVNWPSSDYDTSSGIESSFDEKIQESSDSDSVSVLEEGNSSVSRSGNRSSTSGGSSRQTDTSSSNSSSNWDAQTFLVARRPESNAETQDSVPDVPQINRQVPPFLAWSRADNSQTVSEVFGVGIGLTESALLHLDRFQRSSTPLQELYDAFNDENIYEIMRECSPEVFAHRRRALDGTINSSGSGAPAAPSPLLSGKSDARIKEFLDRCIPVFESFVSPDLPSPLTSKFFGALSMITEDHSWTSLDDSTRDEASDPDTYTGADDDGPRHGWVISPQKATQHGLRLTMALGDDQYKCRDCDKGLIYPSPDKAKAHLREMHLVRSWPDEELWKCLTSVAGARTEWLESEVDAILSMSRDVMGSMLRKLASIQDGVLFEGEFQAPKMGLPYALLDAFKLIVAFVCAVARLLHDVDLFYRDSAHERQLKDMTSRNIRAKKKALLNVGEAVGDLLTKADRALVLPTDDTVYDGPENFMTSVGMHYVGLQIICNIFRMPIHNKKKATSLYEAYVKNLRSDIIRSPKKRQVPVIGALAEELNLLKEFNGWQTAPLRSLETLLQPETYDQDLRRASDRDKLSALEGELITRQMRELKRDGRHVSEVLDLCSRLIQQVRELAEIMEGDQSRAVVVFTVVTVIFLPLSFVASYLSMGGGVEGLEISWTAIQRKFWAIAGPLTTGVAILCLALTGKRSLARIKSAMSVPQWEWPWSGSGEKDPPEWKREAV